MSPHFGLMDAGRMSKVEAMLMRSKLHLRCGKRRLRQGKVAAGLATLYDAMLSGMRWYILVNLRQTLVEDALEELENERLVFSVLKRAGVLDNTFNLARFQELVDRALMDEEIETDAEQVIAELETFMTRIGVLPFNEEELPPEDPDTF